MPLPFTPPNPHLRTIPARRQPGAILCVPPGTAHCTLP